MHTSWCPAVRHEESKRPARAFPVPVFSIPSPPMRGAGVPGQFRSATPLTDGLQPPLVNEEATVFRMVASSFLRAVFPGTGRGLWLWELWVRSVPLHLHLRVGLSGPAYQAVICSVSSRGGVAFGAAYYPSYAGLPASWKPGVRGLRCAVAFRASCSAKGGFGPFRMVNANRHLVVS